MNALPVYSFGGGAKYPNNDERKKERKQGIAFSFTKKLRLNSVVIVHGINIQSL